MCVCAITSEQNDDSKYLAACSPRINLQVRVMTLNGRKTNIMLCDDSSKFACNTHAITGKISLCLVEEYSRSTCVKTAVGGLY